jgi:hypothetical protein
MKERKDCYAQRTSGIEADWLSVSLYVNEKKRAIIRNR